VQAALLAVAVDLRDDADRWAGLKPAEQDAALGVVVALGEAHADAALRAHAGHALLDLIDRAMEGRSGADFARAAELVVRFEAGMNVGRWSAAAFALYRLETTRQALAMWHGPARTDTLARVMADRARALAASLGTPEAKRDVSVSLDNVGRVAQTQGEWAQADALYRESLAICRELAASLGTPEAKRDVGSSLYNVSRVAAEAEDREACCEALDEALPIFEAVAAIVQTPQAHAEAEEIRRLAQAIGCAGAAGTSAAPE
jgi:tetratricopeptide (TPR) repeat protein